MMDILISVQRWVYGTIAGELTGFSATRDWLALLSILPLGALFGAVHALTPGHGKTVLASYLIGSRLAALRALGVAGTLALTHVGSAVIIALLGAQLVTRTIGGGGRAPSLETVSSALLVFVGAWFCVRAARGHSHHHEQEEGLLVGVFAGLVPCPLTLFVMFYALSRGIPEAGLTFALAMMLGIVTTLSGVALLAVVARNALVELLTRHGASLARLARGLDLVSGVLLMAIGLWTLSGTSGLRGTYPVPLSGAGNLQ